MFELQPVEKPVYANAAPDLQPVEQLYPIYPTYPSSQINISGILLALRRGFLLILLGSLLGIAAGVAYNKLAPELYKSTARILIDRSVNRYLQSNKLIDEPTFNDSEIGSQVYVLSSDSIVLPVVHSLDLAHDPDFVPPSGQQPLSDRYEFLRLMKQLLWSPPPKVPVDPNTALERVAVDSLLRNLSIYREDVANVINVTFASKDPRKAAQVANALADTYLSTTLESKANSNRIASQLILDRLTELKQQSMDADRAVEQFKAANSVAAGSTLTADQMTALARELTNAQIAVAEAKARSDSIQSVAVSDSADKIVPDNDALRRLRLQLQDLTNKANDIAGRVGEKHAVVVRLRKQIETLQGEIQDEEARVAGSFANEVKIANARKDELAAALTSLDQSVQRDRQTQTTLRELQSSAENLHALYNTMLVKYNELNKGQSQEPLLDARVITPATPSLEHGSKKPLTILAAGTMLGMLLGAAVAIGKEWVTDVFRNSEQLRRATKLYSLTAPIARRPRRAWWSRRKDKGVLDTIIRSSPTPLIVDLACNLKPLMNIAQRDQDAKVFCVVSSVEGEGKTTVVTSLAAVMAASPEIRTLVIDADMYLRHLTANLLPQAAEGLCEALENPSRLPELVSKWHMSGVDFLPCVSPPAVPGPSELMGSRKMDRLLTAARSAYDYIIIDAPPILSSIDVKMIERFVDQFILVVECGKTKRSQVMNALEEADMIGDRILCAVLNKSPVDIWQKKRPARAS